MSFPDSPRVIYRRNPLVDVTCQFRFPAILRIMTEVPSAFQERIRGFYPDFTTSQTQQVAFPVSGVSDTTLRFNQNTIHEFVSEDKNWVVTLTSDYLALTCRKYNTWQEFTSRLHDAFHALLDIYKPAAFVRIGLRYQDLIRRSVVELQDVAWSQLLNIEIAGLLSDELLADQISETVSQTIIALEDEQTKVRLFHGFAQVPGNPEICYVIDSDFFTDNRIGVNDGLSTITHFNGYAGKLFRWCITERLHHALVPIPIEQPSR